MGNRVSQQGFERAVFLPPSNAGDLPSAVGPRVVTLLRKVLSDVNVVDLSASTSSAAEAIRPHENDNRTLILSIGRNGCTETVIEPEEVEKLGSEGFIVRSKVLGSKKGGGAILVAVDGNQWIDEPKPKTDLKPREWIHGNRAALEELGFAFLHPFAPSIPPAGLLYANTSAPLNILEAPRWTQFRAIHYHTQHPLELTPFLQGWGDTGPTDEKGWESHFSEWELCCEWLLANRQNGFEWAMLESDRWNSGKFSRCEERIQRLKRIVDAGHAYGLMIGVDVPIAFAQQHSFRLLKNGKTSMKNLPREKEEIKASLDWIMKAGFDFLGTEVENGTSEFTHVPPQHMLEWMNCSADYAAQKYNVPMHIKIHCSTGQVAKGFVDERTGDDINYNMLPYYASNNLGVLPHTVETYGLDDPAPTYGNTDFGYMREYIKWELRNGNRSVVFYPETAYWVSFDIDLPLFLPLYAERRVHDLRLIASDEDAEPTHGRMDGQLIFSSGWEWGYWMNDVVAARAAWDPKTSAPSPREAFVLSLWPIVRHLGSGLREQAESLLADWAIAQKDLLILGKTSPDADAPTKIQQRNGHGYLEGWDTWDDVSKLLGKLTQPDRMGLIEFKQGETWRSWFARMRGKQIPKAIDYEKEVAPLLLAMDETFRGLADRTEALAGKVPEYLRDVWDDIADSARITALRARHVRLLYEYVFSTKDVPAGVKGAEVGDIEKARAAVAVVRAAHVVVARRELKYRVPASRIASWTNLNTTNPTAYPFTYLWTVHSLHLWWRDTAQALIPDFSVTRLSFCNIIDPVEVGLGDGRMLHTAESIARILKKVGFAKDYFALSEKEPHYPMDIPHWKEP
ncbi:hypothetical protein HDU67_000319 [Dinochytrium kinnereticum]|nr:hypothetical protein HDU67_000319 [Dinochytrium kinnereticum]